MAAEAAYKGLPATAAPARKLQALKEWLVISLHTVQPPDRVGVVRKLRLGVTLKKEGGSYTLDMTQARYKTSRFYGPSITSMSALLTEPLDAYLSAVLATKTKRWTSCESHTAQVTDVWG